MLLQISYSLGFNCRSSAKRGTSILPPDTRMPTFLPVTSTFFWKTAAAAKHPVGSTTSFMRLAKKRIVSTNFGIADRNHVVH